MIGLRVCIGGNVDVSGDDMNLYSASYLYADGRVVTNLGEISVVKWKGPIEKIYTRHASYFNTKNRLGIGCLWNRGRISNNLKCDIAFVKYYGSGLNQSDAGAIDAHFNNEKFIFGYS